MNLNLEQWCTHKKRLGIPISRKTTRFLRFAKSVSSIGFEKCGMLYQRTKSPVFPDLSREICPKEDFRLASTRCEPRSYRINTSRVPVISFLVKTRILIARKKRTTEACGNKKIFRFIVSIANIYVLHICPRKLKTRYIGKLRINWIHDSGGTEGRWKKKYKSQHRCHGIERWMASVAWLTD